MRSIAFSDPGKNTLAHRCMNDEQGSFHSIEIVPNKTAIFFQTTAPTD
jgi:hypothetical protein